jgi:hypothetical protein
MYRPTPPQTVVKSDPQERTMYAYVNRTRHRPGQTGNGGPEAGRTVAPKPGLVGAIALQQLGGPAAVQVTLRDSEAAANGARSGDPANSQRSGRYEVAVAERGRDAGTPPAYARMIYFDGPRAVEQVAAEERAGRERIWPAVRNLDGLVGLYVPRADDRGSIVIALSTSVDALDASARAAMSTELLPGEDPALLGGPDGIEIHHVTECQLPATEQVAGPEGMRS